MDQDLAQIHHAAYQSDIPFWISQTEGREPILEVGCGVGRVTLPLLEHGRQIVGVDRDGAALDLLRESLRSLPGELESRINLIEMDILDYQPQETFGAVIVPCNTLTTFRDKDRDKLYGHAAAALAESGTLIASMPNPFRLLEIMREFELEEGQPEPELENTFTHPLTGNPVQVSSRMRTAPEGLEWEWFYDQLYPDGKVERQRISSVHYPAQPKSFLDSLAGAGFRTVDTLGNFQGGAYQKDSPYLILVASK